MNSLINYADALLGKARDVRYDDSAGEDEPTIQRTWAMNAAVLTLDWAVA